jgi:hypothetical protein
MGAPGRRPQGHGGAVVTYTVRENSLVMDRYLKPSGEWGDYAEAKRFPSQASAENFARKCRVETFGIFPCGRKKKAS